MTAELKAMDHMVELLAVKGASGDEITRLRQRRLTANNPITVTGQLWERLADPKEKL